MDLHLLRRADRSRRRETITLPNDHQEHALVPLSGTASVEADDQSWKLGGRANVFDGLGRCLYLPRDIVATVTAVSELELAIAGAPATTRHAPVLVTPDDTAIELRGGGNASRQVNSLMLPDFPADRLHVIEVWTPGGNWSSFPPHKHEHDRDGEAQLEETYYYRLRDPENGWAVQRVYSPERDDFDLVRTARDGDLLLIPLGLPHHRRRPRPRPVLPQHPRRTRTEADPSSFPRSVPQGHPGRMAHGRHRPPAPAHSPVTPTDHGPRPIDAEGIPCAQHPQHHPSHCRPGRCSLPRRTARRTRWQHRPVLRRRHRHLRPRQRGRYWPSAAAVPRRVPAVPGPQ
jgi:5-deoxy-glucuronate isomerase